jgi:hypothetical protein
LEIRLKVFTVIGFLLAAWLATPQQVLPGKQGALSGSIAGPEASAVAGAIVLASRQDPDPSTQIRTYTAKSDDKGHFNFPSLPVGSYQLEVSPKDKWLFKQTVRSVQVRDSRNTTIELRFQFIEQCEGDTLDRLTNADRTEIIRFMLDQAIIQKKIPSYPQLTVAKQVILSTENVPPVESPTLPGLQLLLLSPAQIQARANRDGDLMYLRFEQIEPRGSCVAVSLCNVWADGTSSIETGPRTFLGEGCIQYVFTKRNGAWKGDFVTGWIS